MCDCFVLDLIIPRVADKLQTYPTLASAGNDKLRDIHQQYTQTDGEGQ